MATASRLSGFGTTIFTEMSALAEATCAINLGQGFPDEDGPAEVIEAAVAAMRNGRNQYAPLPGVPALRGAIADAVIGLCEPGDELIALDPAYDSYADAAAMADVSFVGVPLHPPGWT